VNLRGRPPEAIIEVPKTWKKVDTGKFGFSMPPEMKQKKVSGIDTYVWQYDAPDISLSIEAGDLGGDFSFERDRYESSVQHVLINGLKAERLVLDLNKPNLKNWSLNADGSTKVLSARENLVVGLYFPDKGTKFWITRTPEVPLSTADSILNSIRFN